MAASSDTVHALMDMMLPDSLAVGLTDLLCSTVTVDGRSFQCGIHSQGISNIRVHRSTFMFVSIARARTLISKQLKIADTYIFPPDTGISVIFVIHFLMGI